MSRPQSRGHSVLRLHQNGIDCRRQPFAIRFGQFNRPPWQRILIRAAAHTEQSDRAGMVLLQVILSKACIIAAPLLKAERRVVTGVRKRDRDQFSIRIAHGQRRHRVIDGTKQQILLTQHWHVRFPIGPAVHTEVG